VAFSCGELASSSEQNQGSAKIFSFAKLNGLDKDATLQLFGRFYRDDVLKNPDGTDHGNIRNFMKSGWDGVVFSDGLALKVKGAAAASPELSREEMAELCRDEESSGCDPEMLEKVAAGKQKPTKEPLSEIDDAIVKTD